MRSLHELVYQVALLSLALTAYSTPCPKSSSSQSCLTTTKSIVTDDGYTYVYDHVAPHNSSMPTFLLIHGYPTSRYYWYHQVQALAEAGYGIIAPDCLGYGDSSKPTDIQAYRMKDLANHMVQILDAENLQDVVGVGHDWGSGVLSRSVVFHPERFSKLVFMAVGYVPPGLFFDVDAINAQVLDEAGYMNFGYWYFFNSYDAAGLMSENLESYFHLIFPGNNTAWAQDFTHLGAARSWLTSNKTTPLPTWLSTADKAEWLRTYATPDTVVGSLNYYQALLRGVHEASEAPLTDRDRTLHVPVLGVGGAEDVATLAGSLAASTEPWAAAGYREYIVQRAGHWMMLEQPDEVSRILIDFARPDDDAAA